MKKASVFVFILLMPLLTFNNASALLLSIDLDPAAGIQDTRNISVGDVFGLDIVLTGGGTWTFDTLSLDLRFNSTILNLIGGPTVGKLAGETSSYTMDYSSFEPVAPGDILSTYPPTQSGSLGGVAFGTIGEPFNIIEAGSTVTVLSLSFQAISSGFGTINISDLFDGPILALGGDSVAYEIQNAIINVEGGNPVPEPCTILLLGSGIFGMAALKKTLKVLKG